METFQELNQNNYQIISSRGFISINENENKYFTFNSLEELKHPMEFQESDGAKAKQKIK